MITTLLDEIIIAADEARCEEFFQSMKESQRKELAPRALQWVSALSGYMNRERPQYLLFDKLAMADIELYQNIASGKIAFPNQFKNESFPIARMAVLATCNFPELKKGGMKALPAPDQAARILLARKPTWLDKWCAYVLKEVPATHWLALHLLEKAGACKLERTSAYWVSMSCSLSTTPDLFGKLLIDDPTLPVEIWHMLADPGVVRMLAEPEQIAHEIFRKRWSRGGNIFAANQAGTRQGSNAWLTALIELAEKGLIDRERLIEYSFTSLAGAGESEAKKSVYIHVSTADFSIKLNQEMTKGKTAAYANRYASLLKAAHKDVSNYASSVLIELPDQSLNIDDICAEIGPAFLNKSKEPAESALKLLARLSKLFPDRRTVYGPSILAAFSHSSKDIHKKALALVESTRLLEEAENRAEFSQRIDMIQGMERAKASALIARYESKDDAISSETSNLQPAGSISAHSTASTKVLGEEDLAALIERAKKAEEPFRQIAGIDEALDLLEAGVVCDLPVVLNSLEFPRLDPSKSVKPISNVDDLIYMFMKVWSGKCSGMEIEALLDGVSRLCNERPEDFEQKTDALRQKITAVNQEFVLFSWGGTLGQVAYAWLGGSSDPAGARVAADAGSVFARRCLAIAKRVISKQPAPLLAAPTHQGGWIDPCTLVKRISEYFWLKIEPDRVDFIQALLRVAPDNRAEALETAGAIKGEVGEALRYALGSNNIGRVITPEYWVAAFRARDPEGTSEELLKLLPNFGPDGPQPAVYGLDMTPVKEFATDKYASLSSGFPYFLPVTSNDPDYPGKPIAKAPYMEMQAKMQAQRVAWSTRRAHYAFFPTVLLHDNGASWFSGTETYIWLHKRESLLALYAKRMLLNIHSVGTYWLSEFDLLFDPDLSMAANGRYFFCFAMSSKNNDISRLAVDALIAAVAECRISASGYGEAMTQVLPTGIITAVRWTRGLRDMAKISTLHAWFVWKSVGCLIESASISATQQIPFLELLTEIQIEHGFKMHDGLKNALRETSGSGKGAKMVQILLSKDANANSLSDRMAAIQCLQGRVERVERWHGIACSTKVETFV